MANPGSDVLLPPAEGGDPVADAPVQQPKGLRWYHWALLVSIDILGPFSTDSYIPNMPEMMGELNTTESLSGLTLQMNWITKAIFNIALGQLSDVIGRRPVIIYSFFFYIIGTLGCSFAPSITWLIVGRVVQAIGEANDAITSAVARDTIDDPNDRMRMLAILGAIRPIAIISAPSVGGLLGAACGWRWVFRLLCLWGTVNCLLTAKLIPETLAPRDAQSEDQQPFSEQLKFLFFNRLTGGLMVTFALLLSGPMCMLSGISFVLENSYGINTALSSLLIGSIPVMMIVASGLVGKFAKQLVPLNLLRTGMAGQLFVAIAYFAVAFGASGTWWASMCVFYSMVLFQSIAIPPLMTLYLEPVKHMAGLASGAQACAQTFIASFLAFVTTKATEDRGAQGLMMSIGSVLLANQFWFWSLIGTCPPRGARLHPSPAAEEAPEGLPEEGGVVHRDDFPHFRGEEGSASVLSMQAVAEGRDDAEPVKVISGVEPDAHPAFVGSEAPEKAESS